MSPSHLPWILVAASAAALVAGSPLARAFPRATSDAVADLTTCPGYNASNIVETESGLTADLNLAGTACAVYGEDLLQLKLTVEYQTEQRLHVKISDVNHWVYQVPEDVLPRPNGSAQAMDSAIQFNITEAPFSFTVTRKDTNEVLFDTAGAGLIFEPQYVRLRTSLPDNAYIYGLGENSGAFNLPTDGYTRTLWNRDRPYIPVDENLYGSHPIYYDHRGDSGTHGVFLLNSNGMDIKLNNTNGNSLEYNLLGGAIDLYFLAGPSPKEVSMQYSQIVGLPALIPYWSLGFHQCKYGYQDAYEVAEVIANYSRAGIPLETMWTDIDYMNARQVFTLDPDRFPLTRMREIVDYLHNHNQKYVLMVDPAVAYNDYYPFNTGKSLDVFMKNSSGEVFQGVVWPGIAAFPDWFAPNTQGWWDDQFSKFFSPDDGVDVDGLWIDMNEPTNFCQYPCSDPAAAAVGNPPTPPPVRPYAPRPIPGFPPDFQPPSQRRRIRRQSVGGGDKGWPNRDLISPPYMINNNGEDLSAGTIWPDLVHNGGLVEYDTHNLYGTMMSTTSRHSMLNRRPGRRPMIITRSTFAGAGAHVGHWTGDNASTWEDYLISIKQLIEFAAFFQIPMVGSDVCGFNSETTENLCARWAMLGAFNTFYRNHADATSPHQEFYLWPLVTDAAKVAVDIRYRLLDYIYGTLYEQSRTGAPTISPLYFVYPSDSNTFTISTQFFYGDAILVSPVTTADSTSVDYYLPEDLFYDWWTLRAVQGNGTTVHQDYVAFTSIPLHIRGGTIIPLREQSANTTTETREKNFIYLVAPGADGTAEGSLYLDDGDSIEQTTITHVSLNWDGKDFASAGDFNFPTNVTVAGVKILGITANMTARSTGTVGGGAIASDWNQDEQSLLVKGNWPLTGGFSFVVSS